MYIKIEWKEIKISNIKMCESHGPGSFAPGRKDPGFVLQYLWNEAIKVCVHFKTFFADSDAEYVVMT